MDVIRIKAPSPQNVVIKNVSSFPITLATHQQDAMRYETISTTRVQLSSSQQTSAQVNTGDVFYAHLPNGKQVQVGVVGLLRRQDDQAGWNHVGHLVDSTLTSGCSSKPNLGLFGANNQESECGPCRGLLKIGSPTQYRDDQIFSQKTTLKTHMGGVPWVDVVNQTNVPLTFYDGPTYPAPTFTVMPGDKYRYKGRAHYGVNYGTYISNLDGIFERVQILSPITHLLYGVL